VVFACLQAHGLDAARVVLRVVRWIIG
jgi:hypothetical protein